MKFDTEAINKVLPHRPPFLFVDYIEDVEFEKRGVGIKEIRLDDGIIGAYLKGGGVMPRTLIIEALAQTAGFVVAGKQLVPDNDAREVKKTGENRYPRLGYMVRIRNFTFSGDAREGDVLRLIVSLDTVFGNIYKFDAHAEVEDTPRGDTTVDYSEIARGNLTFSVFYEDDL